MSLDLALDAGQEAIAEAIGQLCRDAQEAGDFDASVCPGEGGFWSALADLGALALTVPGEEGGVQELVAAHEALGRWAAPGPLVESVLAVQVLEAGDARAVATGQAGVSIAADGIATWVEGARHWLELVDGRVYIGRPRGPIAPLETLGGEPWGRVEIDRGEVCDGGERALAVADAALGAYLAGAAAQLVEAAAGHAKVRQQFGGPIGDFQAVAHPLADGRIRAQCAETLVRSAAYALDAGEADGIWRAAAARRAARGAALEAAHVAHQVFGAVGVTVEGPVFRVSRRIRQLASHPLCEGPEGGRGAGAVLEAVLAGGRLA